MGGGWKNWTLQNWNSPIADSKEELVPFLSCLLAGFPACPVFTPLGSSCSFDSYLRLPGRFLTSFRLFFLPFLPSSLPSSLPACLPPFLLPHLALRIEKKVR